MKLTNKGPYQGIQVHFELSLEDKAEDEFRLRKAVVWIAAGFEGIKIGRNSNTCR